MPPTADQRSGPPPGETPHILFAAESLADLRRRWLPIASGLAGDGLRCTVAAPHLTEPTGQVQSIALPGAASTRTGALAGALALSAAWQQDAPDVIVVDGHRLARATGEVARIFRIPVVLAVVTAAPRRGSALGRVLAHAAPLESRVDRVIAYGAAGALPLGAGVDPGAVNRDNPLLADRITAERQLLAGRGRLLVSALGDAPGVRQFERDLTRREGRVTVRRVAPEASPEDLHLLVGASHVIVLLEDTDAAIDHVLLSAALRTPAVALAGGNTARIVEESGCGLVAKPGEPLVRAVRETLADPMLRRRLGAAGRLLAEGAGSAEQTRASLMELADRVIKHKFGEPVHLTGDGALLAESEVEPVVRTGRRDLLAPRRGGGARSED